MDMKRFFLYAIAIAALALAGCGGGGSSSMDASMGNGDNGNAPDPAAQLSALLTALTGAGLIVTADSTEAEIMAQLTSMSDRARDAVLATIRAALGVTGTPDAMMLASMITDRLGAPGPEPTAKTKSVTFGILGLANLKTGDPNDPSEYMGIDAMTRPGKAMEGERVRARPGASATDTTAVIGVGLTAAAFDALDLLGRVEMIDDPASDDDEDMIANPDNFMPVAGSEVSLAKGFTSNNYMRSVTNDDDETTTDVIAVITDMKDPGSLTWASYYDTADRAGVQDNAVTKEEANDEMAEGQITIQTTSGANSFDLSVLSSSGLPSLPGQTFMYEDDNDETEDMNEETYGGRTHDGRFNDVEGEFTCTETCSASTDSDGKLMTLAGAWFFTPDDVKSMIPDVDHDGDFLAFGWWLRSAPQADDDVNPYSVGTFATGSVPYTVAMAQREDVTGIAKYSGPAAGKFARKTLNPDGSVATLIAGHFTADANLTATFNQTGKNDLAPNTLYSIDGYVNAFKDGDGITIEPTWNTPTGRVNLMKAGFGDGDANGNGAFNPRDRDFTDINTFGGETNGNGSWQGQFFGPDTDAVGAVKPSGVAGEFTNHWSNGHVIGAFGATQDE